MNIQKLIEKFDKDKEYYLSSKYNETQLRTDFLDPFFELLGWDIKNEKGKSTHEREVLVEESLKEDSLSNAKKPDYTFRLFSERKFFLEAKKPNVKIETIDNPAKQLRRYGFTAKLKISLLSNFEYLAIYDCSSPVKEEDLFSHSRIKLYHYSEYANSFKEIKELIGYESVYTGKFDEVWESIEEKLELFCIDKLFLKQINDWRLILGNEIYSNKKNISSIELNDLVQRYINSIIFLRVCEDRTLEEYNTLLNIKNSNDFNLLIQKFKLADKKYNSGLFNHKYSEEIIEKNSSVFWSIIKQLYYPESSYSFSVFSSDILGNIYEIFLGEYLEIENEKIYLKKKPDNIDRDIVTTPVFIIRDILNQTVIEHCKNKTDKEILSSTYADIACGSGAFLLETFQLLNDILIDYYLKNDPKKLIHKGLNNFKLPFILKRKILEDCIYGVDKDFNAVEACKFGLLLKLLEDEGNNTITIPALPMLDKNIIYGNSLIDDLTMPYEVNPYDFENKKFDVIVGNPPYMTTEDMKTIMPTEYSIYKSKYQSAYKQFDKYFVFIERALNLLNENGYFGYIVPSKFTKVGAAIELRKILKDKKVLQTVISFGANQIFKGKTTYTCLLILHNRINNNFKFNEILDLREWKTKKDSIEFDEMETKNLSNDVWILIPKYLKNVYNEILNQSTSLEDLIGGDNIFNGIQTSANPIYIHKSKNEDSKYYYFEKDGLNWKIEKELTRPYYQTSTGSGTLNTYRPFVPNSFVIYPYKKIDEKLCFVEIEELENFYPEAYKYLNYNKPKLVKRDIKPIPVTQNEWYRYGRHQSLEKCEVPAKIIVGVLSQGNKYSIDYNKTLLSSGGTAGYCLITLPEDGKFEYSIYYIQAILNSKYIEWFSSLIGEVFRGGFIARGTKVLKRLPIRKIDFNHPIDKQLHDEISKIQEQLIDLFGELDETEDSSREFVVLKRKFESLKKTLEERLKTLYGLEKEDNLIPLVGELYEAN